VLIIAIIVGLNQPKIVANGLLILAAVILHNLLGFALGYLFARMFGMSLAKRKAVMLETGMQNSGLGAALAAAHFSPLAAVPSALFSVWHNLSGSALATWFAGRVEHEPSSD
jgi:BASS family bile acid:Na+ symporter